MNNKIKIGLIGSGRAGMIHARNFCHQIADAAVVCVTDTDAVAGLSAAQELACEFVPDYNAVLARADVDAVVIAVPTKYHKEIAIAAAQCHKHIFCEKPMAMDALECEAMIAAAQENHVKLQVGFMRRFDESFRRAKQSVLQGDIGEVVMVKSLTHGPSTPHAWMYDIQKSNGPLAEVNSHDIDTLRWLMGTEVKSVYALAGNYRCEEARAQYPDFYDTVLLSLRMENGAIGCIDGAQGVEYGYDARVDILGTKGLITIGDLKGTSTVTYTKNGGACGDIVKSWTNLFAQAYVQEDKSFVQCILEDTPPEVTGADGLAAVKVVKAGNESIRSGQIILL